MAVELMLQSRAVRRAVPWATLAVGCAVMFVGTAPAAVADELTPAVPASPERGGQPMSAVPAARASRGDALEERVRSLTRALALDADQQLALREILERQRETVRRIWSDTKLLPAERGPAVHAATDRTADAIRGILNDEQKQKYPPPRPANSRALQEAGTSVEKWMDATRDKRASAAPPRN